MNPELDLKFTDENEEETVLFVKKLVDLGEEFAYLHTANSSLTGFKKTEMKPWSSDAYKLSRLAEPFREQRVCVHLNQLRSFISASKAVQDRFDNPANHHWHNNLYMLCPCIESALPIVEYDCKLLR